MAVNVDQKNVSGKLQEHPEALPEFTIENVTQHLICHMEQDNLQAEDWKIFKSGGYKLFKEGHVRIIYILIVMICHAQLPVSAFECTR